MNKKEESTFIEFSLTGLDILTIIELDNEDKHLILVGDNRLKVVDVK